MHDNCSYFRNSLYIGVMIPKNINMLFHYLCQELIKAGKDQNTAFYLQTSD